jgi:hypothetical protein
MSLEAHSPIRATFLPAPNTPTPEPTAATPDRRDRVADSGACLDMSTAARSLTKAVIELTDMKDGQAADEALHGLRDRLLRYLPNGQIFVDLYSLPLNALTGNGKSATIAGFSMLAEAGRRFTPIYGFELNDSLWLEFALVTRRLNEGFCFRIDRSATLRHDQPHLEAG